MSRTLVLKDGQTILDTPALKLNKHWQAIGVITVYEAIQNIITGRFAGLLCEENYVAPLTAEQWLDLPVEEAMDYIQTINAKIRVPRVVIALSFDKLHVEPPKLTLKNLRARDNDTCIYTGKKLKPGEISIEHIVPTSKNGKHIWENVALAHRDINSKRGNQDLERVGLTPRYKPFAPRGRRPADSISNVHQFPEWEIFLTSTQK
jgi:hypothetical protein